MRSINDIVLYQRYDLVLSTFGIKESHVILGSIVNEYVIKGRKSLVMIEIVFQYPNLLHFLNDPHPYGTDYKSKYSGKYCIVHVDNLEKFIL